MSGAEILPEANPLEPAPTSRYCLTYLEALPSRWTPHVEFKEYVLHSSDDLESIWYVADGAARMLKATHPDWEVEKKAGHDFV